MAPTSQMVTRDVEPVAVSVEAPEVGPSQEAASYSMESDRGYEAMVAEAASVHREQEMELERE